MLFFSLEVRFEARNRLVGVHALSTKSPVLLLESVRLLHGVGGLGGHRGVLAGGRLVGDCEIGHLIYQILLRSPHAVASRSADLLGACDRWYRA